MKCYLCGKKITPGSEKEFIPVTANREREVHPGCKESAKKNARKSKGAIA